MLNSIREMVGRQTSTFSGVSADYKRALESFHCGDLNESLTTVTNYLVANENAHDTFQCYRLWIEILAEKCDLGSLEYLRNHLLVRGQMEPDEQNYFVALRGLVHLELDEFDAAKLIGSAFNTENSYASELKSRVAFREAPLDADHAKTMLSVDQLEDFFHWVHLAQMLLVGNQHRAMQLLINHVDTVFKGANLSLKYNMHLAADEEQLEDFTRNAKRLKEQFSNNPDYHVFHGRALLLAGDAESAEYVLRQAVEKFEHDVDVLQLYGRACHMLGRSSDAKVFLERAIETLTMSGMPSTELERQLAEVCEAMDVDGSVATALPRQTRMWLVHLTPRHFLDLVTSRKGDIDQLIRPMGSRPMPGDFCFFAGGKTEGKSGEQWRIAAIYTVETEPVWHPVDGCQTSLRLIDRPPVGITVDVQVLDEEGHEDVLEPENSVYELEVGALDIITEAIRMHVGDERDRETDHEERGA